MQVTHTTDSDSFVAIGGEKASRFKFAASAQAFKIMSDTLYRDKLRATAREVICNAIDAHIEAGLPDEPVEVTLTDDELVVQDVGLGIPHDKIDDIYCTMFGSGKAANARLTGGFGLGCKAPFSISDHFTVTSAHKGVKSLYAMVASDPDEEGAPSSKRMMHTGCETQGLTVSIPLAPLMKLKLETIIPAVAREGGMKVRLNGEMIDVPDFTGLREHGYGAFNFGSGGNHRISVLYANVLYPLDANPEFDAELKVLRELQLGRRTMMLYAPPHSVAVTPSRESLSYDDETVKVLKGLLKRAVREIETSRRKALPRLLDGMFSKLKRHEVTGWFRSDHLPAPFGLTAAGPEVGVVVATEQVRGNVVPARDIGRSLVRTHKNDAGRFRKIAGGVTVGESYFRISNMLDVDHDAYVMRRVARAVGVEALAQLYRRDTTHKPLVNVRKPEAYRRDARTFPLAITFAPTVTVARAMKMKGYFLITGKLKPPVLDAVRKRCAKLGVKVQEIPKAEPLPRAPKPKAPVMFGPPCPPRPIPLEAIERSYSKMLSRGENLAIKGFARSESAYRPVAILTVRAMEKENTHFVHPSDMDSEIVTKLTGRLIGRVALAHTREEMDGPLLKDLPRLERVVLDLLQARVKKRKPYEAFYAKVAMFTADQTETPDRERRDDSWRVRPITKLFDRELTHAMMRERYKPDPDRDEAHELWQLATHLFVGRHRTRAHLDDAESKVMIDLYHEWLALSRPLQAFSFGEVRPWERASHHRMLSDFCEWKIRRMSTEERGDFIHIVNELGRRHEARSKKEQSK